MVVGHGRCGRGRRGGKAVNARNGLNYDGTEHPDPLLSCYHVAVGRYRSSVAVPFGNHFSIAAFTVPALAELQSPCQKVAGFTLPL